MYNDEMRSHDTRHTEKNVMMTTIKVKYGNIHRRIN